MGSDRKPFIIISTLGPASSNQEFLEKCLQINQTHFRLNTAHLSPEQLENRVCMVKNILAAEDIQFYADLSGHKLRIGQIMRPKILSSGRKIKLIPASTGGSGAIPIPNTNFFKYLQPNDILYLQDGQIQLEVVQKSEKQIMTCILQGGLLRSQAGLLIKNRNFPAEDFLENLTPHLNAAQTAAIQNIALSYVTKPQEIIQLRQRCQQKDYPVKIIAKIEHPMALENLEKILEVSDQIWYCRGDLGGFIDWRDLGKWQDTVISYSRQYKKSILIAGEVFQHLTENHNPTRSEVVHFYHLQQQGVDGIILSDETARGKHPVNALQQVEKLLI